MSTKAYHAFHDLNNGILSCCCSIIYFSLVVANNNKPMIKPTANPTANFLKTKVSSIPNTKPTAIPIPPLFVLFAMIIYPVWRSPSDRCFILLFLF